VPRPERARGRSRGLVQWILALLLAVCVGTEASERVVELAPGQTVRYRLVDDTMASARGTAERVLRHLAAGNIEDAAQLSNAPRRRYEELAGYRERVGEEEFRRVFGRYFAPENRLVAEVAIDAHRLLVWDLGEAGHRLAGQYYVEAGGKFLMDDVPNAKRSQLRRILEAYRSGKLRFSE
jgi:hypothetical protein